MTEFAKEISVKDAFLLLNGMGKLGPVSIRKLLLAYDNDPREVLSSSRSSLLSVEGVGQVMVESILSTQNQKWLTNEKKELEKRKIDFITDEFYPKLLKEIYDPPIGLYLKGVIQQGPFVSIVGTRQPSLYGQRICQELAKGLAEVGFCIVSGMARGIDSIAHHAALAIGGKTMAFLGSGIDIVYPPENLKLYQEISEKGGVLSEFALGRKADRRTFPMRNRLVSGISSAVIVIESASSGGSLITAQFAAEQGRLVFAVPGRVDQPASAGCNDLIRDGAILVRKVEDVLEELEGTILTGINFSKEEGSQIPLPLNDFTKEEQAVYSVLQDGACLSLEEIMEKLNLSFPQLGSTLSMMEINGIIAKRPDGKFEIK